MRATGPSLAPPVPLGAPRGLLLALALFQLAVAVCLSRSPGQGGGQPEPSGLAQEQGGSSPGLLFGFYFSPECTAAGDRPPALWEPECVSADVTRGEAGRVPPSRDRAQEKLPPGKGLTSLLGGGRLRSRPRNPSPQPPRICCAGRRRGGPLQVPDWVSPTLAPAFVYGWFCGACALGVSLAAGGGAGTPRCSAPSPGHRALCGGWVVTAAIF